MGVIWLRQIPIPGTLLLFEVCSCSYDHFWGIWHSSIQMALFSWLMYNKPHFVYLQYPTNIHTSYIGYIFSDFPLKMCASYPHVSMWYKLGLYLIYNSMRVLGINLEGIIFNNYVIVCRIYPQDDIDNVK